MKKFTLRIDIPIEAFDDIEAREIAKRLLERVTMVGDKICKLQEIFPKEPPRKIEL